MPRLRFFSPLESRTDDRLCLIWVATHPQSRAADSQGEPIALVWGLRVHALGIEDQFVFLDQFCRPSFLGPGSISSRCETAMLSHISNLRRQDDNRARSPFRPTASASARQVVSHAP